MATTAPPASRFKFKDDGRDTAAEALAGPQARGGEAAGGVLVELTPDESFLHPEAATPAPAVQEPPATETSTAPAPTVTTSTQPAPTISTSTPSTTLPIPDKLLAGKFKTPEDMEKAYGELEKAFHTKSQEAATLKKAAVTPVVDPAEKETQRLERINKMLTDPVEFEKEMKDIAVRAARDGLVEQERLAEEQRVTKERMVQWESQNPDIVPYKNFVGWTMAELIQSNPEIDPWAALTQATTNLREGIGAIRHEGKIEALSVQQSVTTPAVVKVNTPPPTEQPSPAPMTDQDAATQHMEMLRSEAARVRRPVR